MHPHERENYEEPMFINITRITIQAHVGLEREGREGEGRGSEEGGHEGGMGWDGGWPEPVGGAEVIGSG